MGTTFSTQLAQISNEIRASMIENLTEYYPVESKNTSFYFLLSAYSDILSDIDIERYNTILDVGIDDARTAALFPNFGYFYSLPIRGDLDWAWADYRFMLKVLGEAWTLYGSTMWGMRKVVQVATGISPMVLEHYKHAGWILPEYILGATTVVQTGNFVWNSVSSTLLAAATLLDVWPQQQTQVWLCGIEAGAGGVWRSNYAGSSSVSMAPPVALSYEAIHGVGPYETWACGIRVGGGVVAHWHYLYGWDATTAVFAGASLRGICMFAHDDGWVVGDGGSTYHWDGVQWTQVLPPGPPSTFYSVHGSASNAIYAAGANSRIIKWNGVVWNDVTPPPTTDWRGVYTLDVSNAWVCGLNGWIFQTTNGGTTWGGPGVVSALVNYYDIWVSSDGMTIRAVGEHQVTGNGVLSYSTDGGATWDTETTQGSGQGYRGIYIRPNDTMGYICGEAGTFLRCNGQPLGYTLLNGMQLVLSDLAMDPGSTTLTSVTGSFTQDMVNSTIRIAGNSHFVGGIYLIVEYIGTNTVVLNKTATLAGAGVNGVGFVYNGPGDVYANGELIYGAILESRHGRRNAADVVVWNVQDYNLLQRFIDMMKPAHIKIYLVHEFPWVSGYYYYYGGPYDGSLGQYTFDGASIEQGVVINGRDYGDSMSRVCVNNQDLFIPQLS